MLRVRLGVPLMTSVRAPHHHMPLPGLHALLQVLHCADIDSSAHKCIFLKAECLQVTGSFKIRGATFAVQRSVETKEGPASPAGVYTHR